jgi:hypothetical protein
MMLPVETRLCLDHVAGTVTAVGVCTYIQCESALDDVMCLT